MTLDQATQKKIYERLIVKDTFHLADHQPVGGSLSAMLRQNEVLADDGENYDTIQEGVDAANNWVFVGPGTFNENIYIKGDDLTLRGCGDDTLIDGNQSGEAIKTDEDHIHIRDLKVRSDNEPPIRLTRYSNHCTIRNVRVTTSPDAAIVVSGTHNAILDCKIDQFSVGNLESKDGLVINGNDNIVGDCTVLNGSNDGRTGIDFNSATGGLVYGCYVNGMQRGGILTEHDQVCSGNRVDDCEKAGAFGSIHATGTESIISNNRISDGNAGINDQGTGTVLDANLIDPEN